MRVFKGDSTIPRNWGPSVVTIGNFDGVHIGHRQLIRRMRQAALEQTHQLGQTVRTVAVTFDPHPLMIHRPRNPPELITGVYEKRRRLALTNLDGLMFLEYSRNLAKLTPEEFVLQYFVKAFDARVVVVGRDIRFGRDNSGDLSTLEQLGKEYGFSVVPFDDFCAKEEPDAVPSAEGAGRRLSSTWVREALQAGSVEDAAKVLGYSHTVMGYFSTEVQRDSASYSASAGPMEVIEGMLPAAGSYSCWMSRPGAAPSTAIATVRPGGNGAPVFLCPIGLQWEPESNEHMAAPAVRIHFMHRLSEETYAASDNQLCTSRAIGQALTAHDQLVS